MSTKPEIKKLQEVDSGGHRAATRRFAVEAKTPVVVQDWCSGDLACQSDQTWDLRIWQRVKDRGYVAYVEGGGQWSNRGDHGSYVGTGDTSEAALMDAWGERYMGDYPHSPDDPPSCLVSACRNYDSQASPSPVE